MCDKNQKNLMEKLQDPILDGVEKTLENFISDGRACNSGAIAVTTTKRELDM
jgi:hypothetical protein